MLISVSKGPPSLRRWTKILAVFHSSDSFVRRNAFSGYRVNGSIFLFFCRVTLSPSVSISKTKNQIWENPEHIFSRKFIRHLIFSSSIKRSCLWFTGSPHACILCAVRHTLHRISSSQTQHLHNAWCAGCTQYAFPQSLEKKSRLIKIRWDSLPELAICDRTTCLNFFLSQV